MLARLDVARLESDYGSHVDERQSRIDRAREIIEALLPTERVQIATDESATRAA